MRRQFWCFSLRIKALRYLFDWPGKGVQAWQAVRGVLGRGWVGRCEVVRGGPRLGRRGLLSHGMAGLGQGRPGRRGPLCHGKAGLGQGRPGRAGPRLDCPGAACCCVARHGRQGAARQGSAWCCQVGEVRVWRGRQGAVRQGSSVQGAVRHGLAGMAWSVATCLCEERHSEARRDMAGEVWRVRERLGRASLGRVRLGVAGEVGSGPVWPVPARVGEVGPGEVRCC
jgi:hypothetical protein